MTLLTDQELKDKMDALKAERVTEAKIKDRIASADYLTHGITTIAVLTLSNGFKVIGHSTPAAPENYAKDIGERYAFDNAFKQLWPLLGFELRQRLFEAEQQTESAA